MREGRVPENMQVMQLVTSRVVQSGRCTWLLEANKKRERRMMTRNKRGVEPYAWTVTKNRCRSSFDAESLCTDFMKRLICFIKTFLDVLDVLYSLLMVVVDKIKEILHGSEV